PGPPPDPGHVGRERRRLESRCRLCRWQYRPPPPPRTAWPVPVDREPPLARRAPARAPRPVARHPRRTPGWHSELPHQRLDNPVGRRRGAAREGRQLDEEGFALEDLFEAVAAVLAAEPGLLVPADRRAVDSRPAVDAHLAGTDPSRDALRTVR